MRMSLYSQVALISFVKRTGLSLKSKRKVDLRLNARNAETCANTRIRMSNAAAMTSLLRQKVCCPQQLREDVTHGPFLLVETPEAGPSGSSTPSEKAPTVPNAKGPLPIHSIALILIHK